MLCALALGSQIVIADHNRSCNQGAPSEKNKGGGKLRGGEWGSNFDPHAPEKFVWDLCFILKAKRGGKLRGGGKHTINPLPKNGFGPPPPPMIRFPRPLCSRNVILLRKRAQTRQIPLSEASKTGFGGGALWYVFPPPPKIARYVLPPPFAHSQRYPWHNWFFLDFKFSSLDFVNDFLRFLGLTSARKIGSILAEIG